MLDEQSRIFFLDMSRRTVIVLDREPLVASDMREEISALDAEAVVHQVTTVAEALSRMGGIARLDLLIVSDRASNFSAKPGFVALVRSARSLMVLSDAEDEWLTACPHARVTRTSFTAASLRRDLRAITVGGAPLFPQRCRESTH